MTTQFFSETRQHFFRPLTGKYRAMVANCLQALYSRLHGPEADYNTLVTRDELIALLLPVVTQSPVLEADGTESEEDSGEDERARLNAIIRQLIEHGWIETLADKSQLVSVYRLTRAGKAFTEGFLTLEGRGLRSRQRNVRNTRNSLARYLEDGDPFNLVDALTTAGQINSDLSDDIDDLHERRAELLRGAARRYREAFDEFLDYMRTHFVPDLSVRLSADSVESHRSSILAGIEAVRSWSQEQLERAAADLARLFAMPTKNAGAFQPLLTHKYVFTRTKATVPHGELPDRTLVKLELPDRAETRALWKRHLDTVETQARLEFEAENSEPPPESLSAS